MKFWRETNSLVKKGWDPTLAYMKRLIDLMKDGRLPELTRKNLRDFGKDLKFYPGIPEMFGQLQDFLSSEPLLGKSGTVIEYYVISGGLLDIIDGSEVKSYLRDFWACDFHTDKKTNRILFPKNSMTFTEKTRCLFQINKGLIGARYKGNASAVNIPMDPQDRRIPFSNMIYIGDGLTDIACMEIVDRFGGFAFGVFDREKLQRDEYRARSWLLLRRDVPLYPAKYDPESRLRREIEAILLYIARRILTP